MVDEMTERRAEPGELCTCGRPAITVFVKPDQEIGYCGIPDGGGRSTPCRFCGSQESHRQPWGDPAVCPQYQIRPQS